MSERGIRKGDRFRWWLSDRSGFQFGFSPLTDLPNAYYREDGRPIRDNGIQVCPSEYDQPPPSTKPLGGEGEIGTGARDNSSPATDSNVYLIPSESQIPVIYVNSSRSIAWGNYPVIYIAGSMANQVMNVNPQIQPGTDKLYLAFQCVGSSITLINGSGITVDFNQSRVVMNSGDIATLIYYQSDSTWHMTSVNNNGGLF